MLMFFPLFTWIYKYLASLLINDSFIVNSPQSKCFDLLFVHFVPSTGSTAITGLNFSGTNSKT